MSSKAGGGRAGVGAGAGTGGGTSDNFGSLGFLVFGLGAGFDVAVRGTPFGAELLPPIFNLIMGTADVVGGVGAAAEVLEALDEAGIWIEGAGGRVGGCACSFLLAASRVLLIRTHAATRVLSCDQHSNK